jgi:hypothetical protein
VRVHQHLVCVLPDLASFGRHFDGERERDDHINFPCNPCVKLVFFLVSTAISLHIYIPRKI